MKVPDWIYSNHCSKKNKKTNLTAIAEATPDRAAGVSHDWPLCVESARGFTKEETQLPRACMAQMLPRDFLVAVRMAEKRGDRQNIRILGLNLTTHSIYYVLTEYVALYKLRKSPPPSKKIENVSFSFTA